MLRLALQMLYGDRAKYAMLVGGLGVGAAAMFGFSVLEAGQPPFYMPWQVPVFTGAIILFICALSAAIGLVKIVRAEPAVVFK